MDSSRKIAATVGVLFIIGTISGILSVVVSQPILGQADVLAAISAHEGQFISAALLILLMGIALALVPVVAYPVFKKYNPTLALAYLIFRGALETTLYLVTVACWLFLAALGREYAAAGLPDAGHFQTLGAVLRQGSDALASILVIIFSLDALMLYTLLYRSRLVPRWISVWGLIAILLHFSTAFLALYGITGSGVDGVLVVINLPILVQEMVMAVWLIAKGFSLDGSAGAPARMAAPVQAR